MDQSMLASTPIMSQSNSVGQGFNIYGELDLSGLIRPLVDFSKAGTRVFTFLGKDYLVPSIINPMENTSTYYNGGTFTSREGFQNQIAVHAGVSASYGAFSGEMQVDYSQQFSQNTQYAYAFNNFYSQLGYLQLADWESYLTSNFTSRLSQLPSTVTEDNVSDFADFFEDFGVYYTLKIVLGGALDFYVSVKKTDQTASMNISAMLNAQYKGLFSSGSLDASVKASQSWQSYSQYSQTVIRAVGGDPAKAAALAGVDPLNPSQDTVSKYNDWVASIETDPAIVDFQLSGVWELCGDKRSVVQQAWQVYGDQMHPRLSVETTSNVINWPYSGGATPPVIIMGGTQLKPQTVPTAPYGYQVIIIDGSNITDPFGVLFDRYYSFDMRQDWYSTYHDTYSAMLKDIQMSGATASGNLLIFASFGLDNNMPPPNDVYSFLRTAGAGSQLQYWEENSDPGSAVGNVGAWISYPACYILVGFFGDGPDTGVEFYCGARFEVDPCSVQGDVYFYRESFTGQYTLGIGD